LASDIVCALFDVIQQCDSSKMCSIPMKDAAPVIYKWCLLTAFVWNVPDKYFALQTSKEDNEVFKLKHLLDSPDFKCIKFENIMLVTLYAC